MPFINLKNAMFDELAEMSLCFFFALFDVIYFQSSKLVWNLQSVTFKICLFRQAKGRRRSRRHTSSTNSSSISHNSSANANAEMSLATRRTSSRLRSRVSSKVGTSPLPLSLSTFSPRLSTGKLFFVTKERA